MKSFSAAKIEPFLLIHNPHLFGFFTSSPPHKFHFISYFPHFWGCNFFAKSFHIPAGICNFASYRETNTDIFFF